MPKGRYRLMTDYMPTRGTRGLEMMYLTATVQVNLDFGSPADMVENSKLRWRCTAGDGLVRQFAVQKWQAYGEFVGTLPRLARHGPRPHRHVAHGV